MYLFLLIRKCHIITLFGGKIAQAWGTLKVQFSILKTYKSGELGIDTQLQILCFLCVYVLSIFPSSVIVHFYFMYFCLKWINKNYSKKFFFKSFRSEINHTLSIKLVTVLHERLLNKNNQLQYCHLLEEEHQLQYLKDTWDTDYSYLF